MIRALKIKFVLINMICVTLILTAVFTAIFLVNSKQLSAETQNTLEKALGLAEQRMPIQFNFDKMGEGKKLDSAGYISSFVLRVNYDGSITSISSDNVRLKDDMIEEIVTDVIEEDKEVGSIKKYRLKYMTNADSTGIDIAFADLTPEMVQRQHMLVICIITGSIALFGFMVVSICLSRWALRPVEKAWNSQKQFAADASHELKTPLTVILANMDILKSNKADKIENQIDWVNNTQAEAQRMKDLANNLLYLTKSGDLKKPQIMEKVNLSDTVIKAALAFEPVAFEHKISIDTLINPDISVSGDQNQMRQLITILLDNAVKYSDDNTTIKVSLKEISSKTVLEVNNTGVPIAKNDLENIFERFYRSDESRSEEGYGLGLSIAKNIVTQHRGTITAKSDIQTGTTFTVTLPSY